MRTHIDCFPCFFRQTIIAVNQVTADEAVHERIIKGLLPVIAGADLSRPPAHTTTFMHRMIREQLGFDPFEKTKSDYNAIAMGFLPELRRRVRESKDPLLTAARLAIAGNIIDFGIYSNIDIEGSVERALEERIAVDDYAEFRSAVEASAAILYLLDNSGEAVFDMLLIEELVRMGKRVRAVVKGSPVLNDVTMADADQIGLHSVCEVIDNGCDAIGTILEWTSDEFREAFASAELVISKGQGNFETLVGTDKKTFFLFQSKCAVVSRELGLECGSMLLMRS